MRASVAAATPTRTQNAPKRPWGRYADRRHRRRAASGPRLLQRTFLRRPPSTAAAITVERFLGKSAPPGRRLLPASMAAGETGRSNTHRPGQPKPWARARRGRPWQDPAAKSSIVRKRSGGSQLGCTPPFPVSQSPLSGCGSGLARTFRIVRTATPSAVTGQRCWDRGGEQALAELGKPRDELFGWKSRNRGRVGGVTRRHRCRRRRRTGEMWRRVKMWHLWTT